MARIAATRIVVTAVVCSGAGLLGGCWSTVKITSEPSGARVWIDGKERGQTPLTTSVVWWATRHTRIFLKHPDCHSFSTLLRRTVRWPEGTDSSDAAFLVVVTCGIGTLALVGPIKNQHIVLAPLPPEQRAARSSPAAPRVPRPHPEESGGAEARVGDEADSPGPSADAASPPARGEDAGKYAEPMAAAAAAVAARDRPSAAPPIVKKAKKRLALKLVIVNTLGMRLMLVREGPFKMGSEKGDERPVHEVFLDDYYISETEVTNAQYEKFDPSHASKREPYSRDDNSPAVRVPWEGAMEFCRRLSAQESRAYRLPTEAEWERAARGTDGRMFPWGNSPGLEGGRYKLNFGQGNWRRTGKRDGYLFCSPVKSYPAGVSPAGCYDMAGNVWEWCLDWYSRACYDSALRENPTGPPSGASKVLRGGAFTGNLSSTRAANRHSAPPTHQDANIGFRIVLVVE